MCVHILYIHAPYPKTMLGSGKKMISWVAIQDFNLIGEGFSHCTLSFLDFLDFFSASACSSMKSHLSNSFWAKPVLH